MSDRDQSGQADVGVHALAAELRERMRAAASASATHDAETAGADAAVPRLMLGITGAPGAGKSTLASDIAAELGPELATVVPMDGFHLSKRLIDGTPLASRKGAIDTFDVGGFISLLTRLVAREETVVFAPEYQRTIDEPVAASILVPRDLPLIIVEGNYLLASEGRWAEVRPLLDEVWFVELPEGARRARLIERHIRYGKDQFAAEAWVDGPDAANARLIASTRQRADRVIASD